MQKNKHYDNNKYKIRLQRKEHYNNKDLFVERTKIYRDEHKAEVSEYMKQHRKDNKEIIKERK